MSKNLQTDFSTMTFDELKEFVQKSENIDSWYAFAKRLMNGDGVAQAQLSAVGWYRLAAKKGHSKAQNNLGVALAYGHGVKKSSREALVWLREAAKQKLPDASYNLGCIYEFGIGVKQDRDEAKKWLQEADILGHPDACVLLEAIKADAKNIMQIAEMLARNSQQRKPAQRPMPQHDLALTPEYV